MVNNPEQKTWLVIGSSDTISSQIVKALLTKGDQVIATSHKHKFLTTVRRQNKGISNQLTIIKNIDVLSTTDVTKLSNAISESKQKLAGIIYTIGLYPPSNFREDTLHPLSTINDKTFHHTLSMYTTGFFNCRQLLHLLDYNGHFLGLGSGAASLTLNTCPLSTHIWHYVAAKAAFDKLVLGFRHDPILRQRNILVHRIITSAIDRPLHKPQPKSRHSPVKIRIPIKRIIDSALTALSEDKHVDQEIKVAPHHKHNHL